MPPPFLSLLLALCPALAAGWVVVSITDYGAVGDNRTDCTGAFRAALAAIASSGGGELIVPAPGLYKTLPVNLTSNTRLTVDGEMWALETTNASLWSTNVSIGGAGEINGAGPFWWCSPDGQGKCPNYDERRPHLVSFTNVTGVEITGVTLRNSAFWTLRPVFCQDVWFHDMSIINPWCGGDVPGGPGGPNTDGIDVDSCLDVMIERCFISVGDDHVTILAGAGESGLAAGLPSRNVTVRDCQLGTGMGLSIGSSVSGGVSDVLFTRNVMKERLHDWGYGAHLKTRVEYGGYIRNIAYVDNDFAVVTNAGLVIETDYQSSGKCNETTCTDIRDIVWRNNTGSPGSPGFFSCMAARPCVNITVENVVLTPRSNSKWGCTNVTSGSFFNVTPPGLQPACGL